MKRIYISPKAEIKRFETEDVIMTSGVTSLTSAKQRVFTAAESNTTWAAGKK